MASGLRWTEEQLKAAQDRGLVKTYPLSILGPVTGRRSSTEEPWCAGSSPAVARLPFPPTVNHIWKSSGKTRYLSKEYEAFLGMVQVIVGRERVPKFGEKRLAVSIKLHGPNKRKYDIDNRVKAVLDSLVRAGVMDDDEQVDSLAVTREEIIKGGLCVVWIGEM